MFLGISMALAAVGFIIYFVVVVRQRLKRKRARERAEEIEAYRN